MSDAKPELIGTFFNSVAQDYDEVHTAIIDGGNEYYQNISTPIKPSSNGIMILNLGCGTGLELVGVFKRAPNAHLHCVDLSQNMLKIMNERFCNESFKITVYQESYLNFEFPINKYDYIIASATLHHLLDTEKLNLFPKILRSLKDKGTFILGDYYVSETEVKSQLKIYKDYLTKGIDVKDGKYHIDIPTTNNNERILLKESGFKDIETIWESSNFAIITSVKRA